MYDHNQPKQNVQSPLSVYSQRQNQNDILIPSKDMLIKESSDLID